MEAQPREVEVDPAAEVPELLKVGVGRRMPSRTHHRFRSASS